MDARTLLVEIQLLAGRVDGELTRWIQRNFDSLLLVVGKALRHHAQVNDRAKCMLNEWVAKQRAGGLEVPDFWTIRADDFASYAEAVIFDYEERLTKMGLDVAEHQGAVEAEIRRRARGEPTGTVVWTDVPKDYDHDYTYRTKETYNWQIHGPDRPPVVLSKVIIPKGRESFQIGRYHSHGMGAVMDEARFEKERAYDTKRQIERAHAAETQALRNAWLEAAKMVQFQNYQGSWQARVDPVEPARAEALLLDVLRRYDALPEEVKSSDWQLRGKIMDTLHDATRARIRLEEKEQEERRLREFRAPEQREMDAQLAAWNEELAADPRKVALLGRMRYSGWGNRSDTGRWELAEILGRHIPPRQVADFGDTEALRRLVKIVDAGAEGIPLAVWKAGAMPPIHAYTFKDRRYFRWKPMGYGEDYIVVDEEGKKVARNTLAFREGEANASPEQQSQDQVIDAAIEAAKSSPPIRMDIGRGPELVRRAPVPRLGLTFVFAPPASPPARPKHPLQGYRIAWRDVLGDEGIHRITMERAAKGVSAGKKGQPYFWQTAAQIASGNAYADGEREKVPDKEVNRFLEGIERLVGIDRWIEVQKWLREDISRTPDDARAHFDIDDTPADEGEETIARAVLPLATADRDQETSPVFSRGTWERLREAIRGNGSTLASWIREADRASQGGHHELAIPGVVWQRIVRRARRIAA